MPESKRNSVRAWLLCYFSRSFREYAGDYVIFSMFQDQDNSFTDAAWFKDLEAVKNGHLFEVNANAFYFNDPITLEHQLKFFEEKFYNN